MGRDLKSLNKRCTVARAMRALAMTALLATLAACYTTGRSFDTTDMSRIIPGQTTLEQASAILKADPVIVYRQRDGSATARWSSKSTLLTDAVYYRRELSLRFGADGRFQAVVDSLNVLSEPGQEPQAALPRQPDSIDQAMPRTVPRGFPYGPAEFGDGPVVVYPVR